MLLYVSVGVVVSNFFFAIVLFQKTANELCLGGSYGSLGFAKKMYLNTFLDSRTTAFLLYIVYVLRYSILSWDTYYDYIIHRTQSFT